MRDGRLRSAVRGVVLLVASAAVVLAGCQDVLGLGNLESQDGGGDSGGGSGGSSGGEVVLTPPTGCAQDLTVDCSGGGDGFSCASGYNPEVEDPTYSCTTPVTDPTSEGDDYCCISFTEGGSTTCMADDELTSVCPDPDSYGYQCDSGDAPTTLDASLNCSMGVADTDGIHDDFCCTYG